MINYEEFPCSLRVSKQSAEETPHQPTVVKEIEAPRPQKYLQPPPEHVPSPVPLIAAAVASTKKKSCLSTNNSKREPPPHPALRRKTVAFGRTVNVSQTVEGTSRNHRKALASSSASSLPADQIMAEEKPEEDWRDVIKTELETMKKEMQEETTRRQEELNAQNFAKMQELMAQFFQQITIPKKPSIEEIETDKENVYDTVRQSRRQEPANKIAMARDVLKREGIISSEALIIVEQRVRSDPMFRQQIDNVLADAECDAHRAAYSPTPPISEVPHTNGAGVNPALMRETLTVERSIRFGNGLSSIDSRQWTTERNQYRPYEPDPPYQSTYQKGQSISYYPSEAVTNNRNNRPGYYLEGISDEEEETVISRRNKTNYEPIATETAAERERRIREKYARKK